MKVVIKCSIITCLIISAFFSSNCTVNAEPCSGIVITYTTQNDLSEEEVNVLTDMMTVNAEEYSTESTVFYSNGQFVAVLLGSDLDDFFLGKLTRRPSVEFLTEDGEIILDSSSISSADPAIQESPDHTTEYVVSLEFDREGTNVFSVATKANIGRQIYLTIDGHIIAAPVIKEEISDGRVIISGDFSENDATLLSNLIKAGNISVNFEQIEKREIP